ncbi:choice-of-anchor D domain-containing protein [bacterium]|nr:choice-of-anchor D domain-containing protein [bacterium]
MKRKIIAVLSAFSMSLLAQQVDNLSLLARWASGPCRSVVATADALYMGNGSYLDILDATNPDGRYSRYEFPGLIQDIYYQSFKIYVAVKDIGIYMLDRSSITSPYELGHYYTEGSARRIAYQDGCIYVADGESGFYIIEVIENTLDPAGYLQFSSPVQDVAVSGDYAYLAVDALGLVAVDISSPSSPAALDTADTPGSAYGVSVRGTTAFVADRNQGVLAVNITDPENINVAGQWIAEPEIVSLSDIAVDVSAETAYLSDEGYGLRVIDLTTMTEKTSRETGGDALSLYIDQNYVYLAEGNSGLKKIDVAVAPPDLVDSVTSGGQAMDVLFSPEATFVAGGESGLWILNHAHLDDEKITIYAHRNTQNAMGLALDGNVLMVADGTGGLIFYNVSNPATATKITTVETANEMLDVTIFGDNAYVAEGTSGIRVVDISNSLEPVDQGLIEGINGFDAIGVTADERSNRVYIAAGTDGLKVLDINTNTITGTYDNESEIQSIGVPAAGANIIYAADGSNGLLGLNVSNTENITPSDQIDTEGYAYDVDFHGDIAVVADGQGTIRLIDLTNPESLDAVGSYHTAGTSYAVDVVDDTVVVADGEGGVYYLQADFTGELQVDADSLDFGNVVLGKSRTLSMIVRNTGSTAVYASELTCNTGRFSALYLPQWISAGETAYIVVRFTPAAYTTIYDTLKLQTDAVNSPHSLPVLGTGIQPTPLAAYSPDYYAYALYHMDALNGATLQDESDYGLMDGTVTGATVTKADDGKFDQGLIFNENDIVHINLESIGQFPSFDKWQGFTIETWFKLNAIPEGTAVLFRLAEGDRIIYELSVNKNRLMGLSSQSVQKIDTLLSNTETPLVRDQWYHAALTMGGTLKLYLNGNLEDQKQMTVPYPSGVISATIGNDAGLAHPFHGVMDEMRLSALERQPWEFNISTGRISTTVSSAAFGSVYVGKSKYYYMTIRNNGEGPLTVDSLFTETNHYDISDTEFELTSDGRRTIWVRFTPSAVRTFRDTLTLHSSDLFRPTVRIPLSGVGFQSISLAAYEPDIYTSGLWHLDGTVDMDSIPDASGNGLIGYFRGLGLSWNTLYKKYGASALRFTGDTSWIWIPYHTLFDYTNTPFSMETWFSLAGKPAANKDYVLFRRGSGTDLQYEVLYNDTLSTGKGLVVRFYAANNKVFSLFGPPDSEMDLEKWYHMAVTWDRYKLRLYLNGVIVDSTDFSGNLRSSKADLAMGGAYGSGRGFNGYLDEIRFSNIDRQPEELNVGIPNLAIATKQLDFGTVFIESDSSRTFAISNFGALPLIINSMTTRTSVFEISPDHDTLTVNETITVTVRFVPQTAVSVKDTLRIHSNDPDMPVYEIVLTAAGIDYRPKAPYALDDYTIALYHCDAAANTVADATGKYNGTLHGSRTASAYFDGGLEFNGFSDYAIVNDAEGLRFDMASEPFTIECFFKTDTLNQVIFFKDPYRGGDNRANYGLSIDTNGLLSLHGFGKGTAYVADGVWHHVAFVYDTTNHRGTLYLDGEIQIQSKWEAGDTDISNSGPLCFGVRETAANQRTGYFQGQMDEIRISSIARQPWDLIFKGTGIFASISGNARKNNPKSVDITLPASEGEAGREVWLHYRQGGKRSYQTLQATPVAGDDTGTQYSVEIPAPSVTERGLEFYVEMTVSGETYTHPLYDPVNRPLTKQVRFNALMADTTLPGKKYTMISVPGDLDDVNAGAVLEDDLGSWDPYKWRCLTWKDTMYCEYDDTLSYADSLIFSFDQGRAFWLISASEKSWNVGAGYSVSTETPCRYHIRPQWNMIGSPFAFQVNWNDCALTSDSLETLYYYDGKGYRLDWPVFEPWGGYWIYNASQTYQDLYVPPREPAALTKQAPVRGSIVYEMIKTDWVWQLSARTETAEDLDNFFGVRHDAMEAWDLRDRAEPPPMGDYISVYFDHSDWKQHPGTYAADIREINHEGYTWNVVVETRLQKSLVEFEWILHQSMPEDWQVRLVDPDKNVVIDMISKNEYAIVTGKDTPNVRKFQCIAGLPEYVEKQVENVIAPIAFHLYQNYPNPFNPETTIRYTLPASGRVRLSIFNMLGQRVTQLVNEEQTSGEYELHWSGVSDRGTRVSSGVYFYRLEYPGRVAIRKMILIQ